MEKIQYSRRLKYKRLGDGKCTLMSIGRCKDKEIIIPPNAPFYGEVVSISNNAFQKQEQIKTVTLPDTIKSIGAYAFYHCANLTSVHLPNHLQELGEYSFLGCKSLKTIILPKTLLSIPNKSFAHCDNLESINLDHVKQIANGAFYYCEKLTSVDLHSVQWLEAAAFNNCTKLETIIISDNLHGLGAIVFDKTAYFMNPKNWTPEGILYLGGWVLRTTGENRPYVLAKNTKGRAIDAFQSIYEKKEQDNPNTCDYDEIFWACVECGGYWDPILYNEDLESKEKYTIELIYPGTIQEWQQVKKWTLKGYKKYPYRIQTTDGEWTQEF